MAKEWSYHSEGFNKGVNKNCFFENVDVVILALINMKGMVFRDFQSSLCSPPTAEKACLTARKMLILVAKIA